jgi:F-type H+-transporting ATPase subunit gamma
VRAQQRVSAAVPYSDRITEVVRDLAQAGERAESPLLVAREQVRRVGFVVLVADRGLCGAYNANVLRAAEGEIREEALRGRDYSIITVGRKAEAYYRFRGYRIDAVYSGFSDNPSYEDAKAVAREAVGRYLSGEVDAVRLVYTRFASLGYQEVVSRPLAPLEEELVADTGPSERVGAGFEFEPSPGAILETLMPRYAEARVYAALLNAAASEHAARQRAMKAATDNAEELIRTLTRIMNRARQDAITTEIMEIVGGAEALSQGTAVERSEPNPEYVAPPDHEHAA